MGAPAVLVFLLATTAILGCGGPANPKQATKTKGSTADGASAPTGPPQTPEQTLQFLIRTYRESAAYQDQAVVRLSYTENGIRSSDVTPLSVALRRADRSLRVRAYQVDVCCSEGRLMARVIDPSTGNLDNQVVDTPCDALTIESLTADAVLADLLGRGLARQPIQIELLLGSDPLRYFLDPQRPRQLQPEATIDGRVCYGVAVGEEAERFVFWIDKETFLLRKLDYPTAGLAVGSGVQEVSLAVEFQGARLSAESDQFAFQAPPSAKRVRYFVPPPQPLPTTLYGKRPPDFRFTGLDGAAVTSEQLRGRPAVLLWFSDHPACEAALRQVDVVRDAWPDMNSLAVCTEPLEYSNQQLEALVRRWGVKTPIARDLDSAGRDVFGVPSLPTLVVLDKEGQVQVFDVGYNERLADELMLVLRMLQQGADVAQQVLQRSRSDQAAYRQDLVAAGAEGIQIDFPIAAQSEPRRLTLTLDWHAAEFKLPGNLAAYAEQDGAVRIAALEGLRSVVVLDPRGERLSAQELDLPKTAGVTVLKTATAAPAGNGAAERYFLAYSTGGEQAFLFDARWQLLAAHPREPLHDGILDSMLATAADGKLAWLTGYRHAGLHMTDAKGLRRWVSRDCDSPNSIDWVDTAEGPRILAVDPGGLLHIFSADGGRVGDPGLAAGWPLYHIFAARFALTGGTDLCGVSYDALGQRVVVGMDLLLTEQWRVTLPAGAFPAPLQFVASGTLLGTGCWIAAGPDGSLHVATSNGQLHDTFNYGESIRGLAITPDQRLVVATASGIRCWSIREK